MICIHHNKDLDGYTSGAIVKYKYPEAKLIGYDYAEDAQAVIDQIPDGENVIMIDITLSMKDVLALSLRTHLTVIDHHVSFKKQYDELSAGSKEHFKYIYKDGIAACEIGWWYLFGQHEISKVTVPHAITLLGKYDTWRQDEMWESETLPFQYFMRQVCTSPETFPEQFLAHGFAASNEINQGILTGKAILDYQKNFDMLNCKRAAFETIAFGYLRAICLNQGGINSNTFESVYDSTYHALMIGFQYTGRVWSVSLRTDREDVDVSEIAKARGGGGHRKAAGFEVEKFEDIFK